MIALTAAVALAVAAATAAPRPASPPLPLQGEAERVLQAGAAGALMDVSTGRLLVLVRPDELVRQAHAPGALMKLVAAWAALRADLGTRTFECLGKDVHRGVVRRCWRRDGHGRLGLRQALSAGCDIWFYKAARLLGPPRLAAAAREMGLGRPTGSDVPGEAPGALPEPLREGAAPDFAVGLTDGLTITGMQALSLAGALANGGTLWAPLRSGEPIVRDRLAGRDELEELARAMRDAVQSGAGAAAGDLPIAGIAGAVPTPGAAGDSSLAWFAGFAPDDAPQVAVVAFVPDGLGAADAATAASDLVRVYFQWKDRGPAGP